MTEKDRFHYYVRHMFSPETLLRTAAGAGLNQWNHTPTEWGQGVQGYAQRYASIFGEHAIHSTVMYAASAALHEDNRYFRSGLTGFGPRLKYALMSTVLARHDDGSRHFSISRMAGFATAAGISRAWQPPSTSGLPNAANSFGVAIGVEAGFNVAREFLPLLHARPPVSALAPAH
jgi:hypothetical protein